MDKRNLTERDICNTLVLSVAMRDGWADGEGVVRTRLKGIS